VFACPRSCLYVGQRPEDRRSGKASRFGAPISAHSNLMDVQQLLGSLKRVVRGMSLRSKHDGIVQRSYMSLAGRAVAAIALLLFSAAALWAQESAPNNSDTNQRERACHQGENNPAPPPQAESQADKAGAEKKPAEASEDPCALKPQDESEGRQTNRILGVVPNFGAVSANTLLPPLTAKGKFWLATEDSFDYSSFVWTGIISAQEFALNNYPEFGRGGAAYGRYYYHSFVDGVSGTYFTEAIVPWISHEDPRYYTLGHGGFFRRTAYSLSRVVLTKTDSGGTSFNWSEVGGNALEAGLANAYYPPQERGGRQTAINWADQIESAALNNIAKEFWPDIRHFLFRKQ